MDMKRFLTHIKWQRILIQAPIAYAIFVGILFIIQRSLLYYPFGTYQSPNELGLDNVQELRLPTADNHQALAWFSPPPEDSTGRIIVHFHGNADALNRLIPLLNRFRDAGFGYLALEYRGYPGYEGETTEEGIYHDARAAMDFVQSLGFKANDIILFGRSLGTGAAVQMAAEYPVALVALVSPFTTVADAAAGVYWYIPVDYLVLDRFDSLSKIDTITSPIYIFHGTEDTLVPFTLGQQLYDKATTEKQFFSLEKQDHNQIDLNFVIEQISAFDKKDATAN